MLCFASEYRLAIDMLTSDPRHGLQVYKLNEEEWTMAEQLSDILKVCLSIPTVLRAALPTRCIPGLEGRK
jgi:hypothetical protein